MIWRIKLPTHLLLVYSLADLGHDFVERVNKETHTHKWLLIRKASHYV